ncbi:ABC transporter substrate-binding protein [Anaerocolumna xylanovorans]|uniref:Lactose/L-arabinose transport system substrate-binding protein n=1 Tax=Anaerocolumna xylanovorans DSM 12503 TaxID=1121345 RepID=A0A1M7Y5G8_9FIRM|nr:ABC transporter substrate-binding protein [Anaerocolumna xylanovorans]SHO47646.1 lactose/L-arabinose transport system substrate-binding protein [Anaerocolumna xylanovorans DSM 12503]
MKKRILATFMAIVLGISLTACGGTNAQKGTDDGTSKESAEKQDTEGKSNSQGEQKLIVWAWDKNFNVYAMNKAAEIYSKNHEGITVDVQDIMPGDIETKITTALAAGDTSTLPDIFLLQDVTFPKMLENYTNVFTDLSGSGIDFSQFAGAKVSNSVMDGKNYGVPFDNGAVVNFLRTDYLEKAGFTAADFTDITWSDWLAKAKVVKEKTGLPMLMSQAGSPNIIYFMMQSCGASFFDKNGNVNIANNDILKQCIDIYLQMIKDKTLVEVASWDELIGGINNGTAASVIQGCWMMATITSQADQSGKWAFANMPKLQGVEGATNYANSGGATWVVAGVGKQKELAIDFLKETFAGSTELYDDLITAGTGAVGTWSPAKESAVYNQASDFFGGEAVNAKILEYASKIPTVINTPYDGDAQSAVGVAVSNIVQQGADIESELKSAEDTVKFNMGN